MSKIKSHLSNLMLASTSHGLPSMFRAERTILKIMWFIFFIVSTSCGCYFCARNLVSFFEFEYVTQVDVINEIPIQFPSVTFYNLIDSNYSLDEILINCYFNDNDCSVSDFEVNSNSIFKFNSGIDNKGNPIPFKYTKQAGKETGLQLELFVGLSKSNSIPKDRYNRFNGFHVTIHNSTIQPRNYDGFEISTGFSTSFIITKVISSKLPSPYNDCYKDLTSLASFDSTLFKFMLNTSNYDYRQKDCFDLCLSQELINACNKSIQLDYSDNIYTNYASDKILINCFDSVWTDFFSQDMNKKCSIYCPLECNSINFLPFTSFSKFPNNQYVNELLNNSKIVSKFVYNLTQSDVKNSILSLNIYYEELKYTKITQIPSTSVLELVANMGGILGLFIGISFLSFGELFEIIFEIIFILLENEKTMIK